MKRTVQIMAAVLVWGGVPFPAKASIIIDYQPHPFGGSGSDTSFQSPIGQTVWQQIADDFVWNTNEQLTDVNFWGFYNADNPPAIETFRIRLYSPRLTDGLPGDVVHEEMIQDLTRTPTGRIIQTGIGPREFLFESTLAAPIDLIENARYWLEVVQIGDTATHFRWEDSIVGDISHTYRNLLVSDWRTAAGGGDQAFQLVSPEASSVAMYGIVLSCFIRTRSRRTPRMIHVRSATP